MTNETEHQETLESLGLSVLNIPERLQNEMQWAVSTMRLVDPTTGRIDKAPRNPKTGEMISVMDPAGWTDFYTAINAGYPAIGMRMTKDDPFTVIDLDKTDDDAEKQLARKIYDTFDSYTEKSYSGKGLHIILEGFNQAGRRKGNVEVYSQDRYIICTGRVVKDVPIKHGLKSLENLIGSMVAVDNPDAIPLINDVEEKESDGAILRRMFEAANGESVKTLFYTDPTPSDDWSQLDSKLAQHICFYTRNRDQAIRIFSKSKLWRGNDSKQKKSGYHDAAKYVDDYLVRRTFNRAWYLIEQRAKESEMSEEAFQNMVKENKKVSTTVTNHHSYINQNETQLATDFLPTIEKPSGLVGEIAQYIYDTAPRPVWEVAISGALTFMSGIAGRHYNINGSGLGLYTLLLAKTGRGKEAANSGISNLMDGISKNVPAVMMFRGPSHIASGQGLVRSMSDQSDDDSTIPSKMLILSEFGHTLNIITSKDATAADMRTRQALLDYFSKNSWGSVIKESAYADKQNNTASVSSPNLCILGDTTPDLFFKSVNLDIINEGFLPRFLIIEYTGPRTSPNYVENKIPPEDLTVRCQTLVHQIIAMRDQHEHINIGYSDTAKVALDNFNEECDAYINMEDQTAEMWNRAHLLALRIAGNLAVGNNLFAPVVQKEDAEWAIALVKRSVKSISHRIDTGHFGRGDDHLLAVVKGHVIKFFEEDLPQKKCQWLLKDWHYENGLLPHSYLYNHVKNLTNFRENSRGAKMVLDAAIRTLTEQGVIAEMNTKMVLKSGEFVNRTERSFAKGPSYDTIINPEDPEIEKEEP